MASSGLPTLWRHKAPIPYLLLAWMRNCANSSETIFLEPFAMTREFLPALVLVPASVIVRPLKYKLMYIIILIYRNFMVANEGPYALIRNSKITVWGKASDYKSEDEALDYRDWHSRACRNMSRHRWRNTRMCSWCVQNVPTIKS